MFYVDTLTITNREMEIVTKGLQVHFSYKCAKPLTGIASCGYLIMDLFRIQRELLSKSVELTSMPKYCEKKHPPHPLTV